MKQSYRFLTMLFFATLFGTSAFALDWVVPAPKASPLVLEDTFAIRNVGQNAYLFMGEAWGTQGIVDVKNGKFLLIRPEMLQDGEYDVYALQDNSKGWGTHYIWRQPNDGNLGPHKGCFVDNGSGTRDRLWSIVSVGENVYTLQVPAHMNTEDGVAENLAYVEGEFLGIKTDHGSNWAGNNANGETYGIYYDVVYAENPANCQWEFVKKSDIDLFDALSNLKKKAEEADDKGVDVSAAKAVFDKAGVTIAEINEAIAALSEAIAKAATPDKPSDLTSLIVNPTFDSNIDGWSRTMTAQNNQLKTSTNDSESQLVGTTAENNPCGVGYNTFPFFENWNPSANNTVVGKLYQNVTNLPDGVYKASLSVFVNNLDAENATARTQFMYAGNEQALLTQSQMKEYSVMVAVEGGELEIGFEQTAPIANWIGLDNAKLMYYGNSLDSYKYLSKAISEGWEEEFVDAEYNQAYYDAVVNALASAEGVSTKEEAIAAYASTQEALKALRENVKAYAALRAEFTNLYDNNAMWDEFGGDEDLVVYVEDEMMAYLENHNLTTEEVNAELAKLEELKKAAADATEYADGEDLSYKIVNPDFTSMGDKYGWTMDKSDGMGTPTFFNGFTGVLEMWASSFDIYQTIRLPKGAYRLSTRAFYRVGGDADAWNRWRAVTGEDRGDNEVRAWLYADNMTNKVPNVFVKLYTDDEVNTYFPDNAGNFSSLTDDNGNIVRVPNGVYSANDVFNSPEFGVNYDSHIDFIVKGGQDVRIGIKANINSALGGWTLWDDFKLEFLTKTNINILKPLIAEAVANAKALAEKPMAKDAAQNLQNAIAAAEAANDGDAIFEAYGLLNEAMPVAQASADKYQKLVDANAKLADALVTYGETAGDEALATANSLYNEIVNGLEAGSFTDEDLTAKIEEIDAAIAALKRPRVEPGFDNDPKDWTGVIVNPTYTDGKNGWTESEEFANKVSVEQETTAIGTKIGFAEGWNTAFDIYQDIEGLPEGTYRVTVQGLYRQSGTGVDAKTWKYGYAESLGKLDLLTDEEKTDVAPFDPRAKVYANNDTIDFARWIFIPDNVDDQQALTAAEASQGSWTAFEDNITDPLTPITYFYPNNRLALANRCDYTFADGVNNKYYDEYQTLPYRYYLNVVYCYVTDNGKLRIGACNKTGQVNDWVPFSNWTLEYLGTQSSHEGTTGLNTVNAAQIISQEVYTIDGRRANKLAKGLNIVKATTADGKTIVKKVMVK